MTTIVKNASIEFHNSSIDTTLFDFIHEDEMFGTLKLKMKKTNITQQPILLLFTIDKTASMREYASPQSTNTKMDYVIQTFKNILFYLAKQDANISICVQTFNDCVDIIIPNKRIDKENVKEFVNKIDEIDPEGPTDIGFALGSANKIMNEFAETHPFHDIYHIFMTDGYATCGETKNEYLFDIASDRFQNIFIGFGLEHNVHLLKKLSEKKNSDYQFINHMEDTSIIYGEIIHRWLYPSIKNVNIVMENGGVIYDWKTNGWTDNLYEPVIISEIEKIYHIKKQKKNMDPIVAKIYGCLPNEEEKNQILVNEIIELPELYDLEKGVMVTNDLSRYLYRHKTMELLNEAKSDNIENRNDTKKKMKEFFRNMQKYMHEHHLTNDVFMKLLCDDIYVTYQTFQSSNGLMYALARYTSQGRQQTYCNTPVKHVDTDDATNLYSFKPPSMFTPKRKNRNLSFHFVDEIEAAEKVETEKETNPFDLDNYEFTNTDTTCYATESVLDTMSQLSTPF